MAAQRDGEDEEQELDFGDYTEHTEAERKGYILGYKHAAMDITKALENLYVDAVLVEILLNHCMEHIVALDGWRVGGEKQPPPVLSDVPPDLL